MNDRIPCPDHNCQAPAQIIAHWTLPSTDGPVGHVRTRCDAGHVFTPTVDMLSSKPLTVTVTVAA